MSTKGNYEMWHIAFAIIAIALLVIGIGIIITLKTGQETWITKLFRLKPWIGLP